MIDNANGKVGFLESNVDRKSANRLTIVICASICVFATLVEGCTQVATAIKDVAVVKADWVSIAYLVGVLLLGSGVIKGAQNIKSFKSSTNGK